MGHHDGCREGYCGCGQPEGFVWACGRRGCSSYHKWLETNDPAKHKKLLAELELENERAILDRIAKRKKDAKENKRKEAVEKKRQKTRGGALSKLTPAERKALDIK